MKQAIAALGARRDAFAHDNASRPEIDFHRRQPGCFREMDARGRRADAHRIAKLYERFENAVLWRIDIVILPAHIQEARGGGRFHPIGCWQNAKMHQHIAQTAFGNGEPFRIDRAATAQFAAKRDLAAPFRPAAESLITALTLRATLDIGEGCAKGAERRQLLLEQRGIV